MELFLHSPYAFTAWCLVKHRDNCTLPTFFVTFSRVQFFPSAKHRQFMFFHLGERHSLTRKTKFLYMKSERRYRYAKNLENFAGHILEE